MATLVKKLKKHIFLHPKDKHNMNKAVKATLLQDKKKYSDKLEGALLDVSCIKVLGDKHQVVDGYISMEVIADFMVFCPQPGMEMEGTVNKLTKSHLGCLVLDTFNASLSLPKHTYLDPREGSVCQFKVTEVVVEGEILFLRGIVKSCQTNPNIELTSNGKSTTFEDVNEETNSEVKEEPLSQDKETTFTTPDKKTKTKKKRKSESQLSEENLEISVKEEPISSQESISSSSVSKKKRKRKSELDDSLSAKAKKKVS